MRNPLEQLERWGAMAMARLLLCLLATAPLGACLLPQDDQVIPDLPPRANRPVQIKEHTPASARLTWYTPANCPKNVSFSVVASDLDVSDTLRSLWFIDFVDANSNAFPYPTSVIAPNGKSSRTVSQPTSNAFSAAMSNLTAASGSQVHLLTVIVADSELSVVDGKVLTPRPALALDDGGTVDDPGTHDSYTWVLDVEPCQ